MIGNASSNSITGAVNWTATSDGRFKRNVQEDVIGLEFINQLRPVTYELRVTSYGFQNDEHNPTRNSQHATRFTGFIAQEVEQAALNTAFDFSGIDKPSA